MLRVCLLALLAVGLGAVALVLVLAEEPAAPPVPAPAPPPIPAPQPPRPKPRPKPCPGPGPCPVWLQTIVEHGQLTLGGPVAPDGSTQVQCDLPLSLRLKNVGGSDGAGLCVFSSINMAGFFQNERRVWKLQEQMKREPGGGWPQKVDQMLAKYAPGTAYLQYEGKDPGILLAAVASGRMPSVTYCGRDPHYRGSVAHMVNLVYLDSGQAAVLDNNFIGDNELVWMSASDFLERWAQGGNGWAVILLAPAPVPVPRLPATSPAAGGACPLFASEES